VVAEHRQGLVPGPISEGSGPEYGVQNLGLRPACRNLVQHALELVAVFSQIVKEAGPARRTDEFGVVRRGQTRVAGSQPAYQQQMLAQSLPSHRNAIC
jgi:hypothetical protein